jgi:hypothetical protein
LRTVMVLLLGLGLNGRHAIQYAGRWVRQLCVGPWMLIDSVFPRLASHCNIILHQSLSLINGCEYSTCPNTIAHSALLAFPGTVHFILRTLKIRQLCQIEHFWYNTFFVQEPLNLKDISSSRRQFKLELAENE